MELVRLTVLLESIRGRIQIERSEIVNPRVQLAGDVAILTFQFVSAGSEGQPCWNSTEVYRRSGQQWSIIHSHWSFANAAQVSAWRLLGCERRLRDPNAWLAFVTL
jgi:hypothetical protein